MVIPTNPPNRLYALIESNQHMTLATADVAGQPWASPVFYAYDEDHLLYWVSAKNARHSENIRSRAQIGIVIYETGDHTDAVYVEAEAQELNDPDEVVPAIAVMESRPQPERWTIKDITDVTGDAVWRIYRTIPKQLYLREEATEGGQAIARRRSAPLGLLRARTTTLQSLLCQGLSEGRNPMFEFCSLYAVVQAAGIKPLEAPRPNG